MAAADEAYDSPSWWYDLRGFCILKLSYRGSLIEQVKFFGDNIGTAHLEVAIGSGTLFNIILKRLKLKRKRIGRVIGFDYTERMLDGARRRFRRNEKIQLQVADVHALPYPDDSFETVNVANAMHCFSQPERALRELRRVLRPGSGRLAVNVLTYPGGNPLQKWVAAKINQWGMKKGILYSPYEPKMFKEMVGASGFTIVAEYQTGNGYHLLLKKQDLRPELPGPGPTSGETF